MRVVLASASPARLSVLRAAGLDPEVKVSGVDETEVSGRPAEVAQTLAQRKAEAVVRLVTGSAVIVGCDSVLDMNGVAYGKPESPSVATERWKHMRGRTGTLTTGHCLIRTENRASTSAVATTHVAFGNPTDAEIAAYVSTGEPLTVAGGFTLDGYGGWFVDSIQGDPSTVIGISLPLVRSMLQELSIPITTLW